MALADLLKPAEVTAPLGKSQTSTVEGALRLSSGRVGGGQIKSSNLEDQGEIGKGLAVQTEQKQQAQAVQQAQQQQVQGIKRQETQEQQSLKSWSEKQITGISEPS